jgi:hypothetical protein
MLAYPIVVLAVALRVSAPPPSCPDDFSTHAGNTKRDWNHHKSHANARDVSASARLVVQRLARHRPAVGRVARSIGTGTVPEKRSSEYAGEREKKRQRQYCWRELPDEMESRAHAHFRVPKIRDVRTSPSSPAV